jgi:hypothetical protein
MLLDRHIGHGATHCATSRWTAAGSSSQHHDPMPARMLKLSAGLAARDEGPSIQRGSGCGGDLRSPLLHDSPPCIRHLNAEFPPFARLRVTDVPARVQNHALADDDCPNCRGRPKILSQFASSTPRTHRRDSSLGRPLETYPDSTTGPSSLPHGLHS